MSNTNPANKVKRHRNAIGNAKVAQEPVQEGGKTWKGSTISFGAKKSPDLMSRYNAGGRKS